jgi:hypothetical protein
MRYSVQHPATLRAGPRDLGQMSPYLKWFERFCHVELRPETLKRCRKFEGPNDQFVTSGPSLDSSWVNEVLAGDEVQLHGSTGRMD